MAQLYLTLPSNSSARYYDNNTLTRFTTRLLKPLSLTGDWEIGLSEIAFTKSWYNLQKTDEPNLYFSCSECARGPRANVPDVTAENDRVIFHISIPPGCYETEDLVDKINGIVQHRLKLLTDQLGVGPHKREATNHLKLKYNPLSRRISVTLYKKQAVMFSDSLSRLLGFTERQMPLMHVGSEEGSVFYSKRHVDMNIGLEHLFVYTDVAESVPIGDTCGPLLRVVDAEGKHGHTVHRIYDRPRYIPLQKKHFDSIEILITSDTGEQVTFEYEKVVVTLHLRNAKQNYFIQ